MKVSERVDEGQGRERAEETEIETALRECSEAWIAFSIALVAAFQRPECGPGQAVAYAARYRHLEPLIGALNAGGPVEVGRGGRRRCWPRGISNIRG